MMTRIPFDPGDLRRWVAPHGVRSSLSQVISTAWMFSPPENKSVAGVRRTAEQIVAEAVGWWRPLEKPNLEQMLSQPDEPDAPTALNPAEGLKLDDFKGLDPARFAARNALMTCWMALPPERRNDDEVERIVRLLLDRCLAALDEDAALFEHPLR